MTIRRFASLWRYRRAMHRARRAYRNAVARGGRDWTREELYERIF